MRPFRPPHIRPWLTTWVAPMLLLVAATAMGEKGGLQAEPWANPDWLRERVSEAGEAARNAHDPAQALSGLLDRLDTLPPRGRELAALSTLDKTLDVLDRGLGDCAPLEVRDGFPNRGRGGWYRDGLSTCRCDVDPEWFRDEAWTEWSQPGGAGAAKVLTACSRSPALRDFDPAARRDLRPVDLLVLVSEIDSALASVGGDEALETRVRALAAPMTRRTVELRSLAPVRGVGQVMLALAAADRE